VDPQDVSGRQSGKSGEDVEGVRGVVALLTGFADSHINASPRGYTSEVTLELIVVMIIVARRGGGFGGCGAEAFNESVGWVPSYQRFGIGVERSVITDREYETVHAAPSRAQLENHVLKPGEITFSHEVGVSYWADVEAYLVVRLKHADPGPAVIQHSVDRRATPLGPRSSVRRPIAA